MIICDLAANDGIPSNHEGHEGRQGTRKELFFWAGWPPDLGLMLLSFAFQICQPSCPSWLKGFGFCCWFCFAPDSWLLTPDFCSLLDNLGEAHYTPNHLRSQTNMKLLSALRSLASTLF